MWWSPPKTTTFFTSPLKINVFFSAFNYLRNVDDLIFIINLELSITRLTMLHDTIALIHAHIRSLKKFFTCLKILSVNL